MTLQALTYFVKIVELESFTAAAKECFVTQPALSRAIGELETELQHTLFERTGKGATPTAAGRICYEEALKVLRQCDTLVSRVQNETNECAGELHLCYLFNGTLPFLAESIQKFKKLWPNVIIHTQYEDYIDARRMLETGELDIAVMAEATASSLENVRHCIIEEGGLQLVVPSTHRLYENSRISLKELENEDLIIWDQKELPGLYERTMDALRTAGVEPKIRAYSKKLGDAVAFAITSGGLGFTTYAAKHSGNAFVRIIPAEESVSGFGIDMVMAKNNRNPFARSFFSTIKP